jgi:hypothetical protein
MNCAEGKNFSLAAKLKSRPGGFGAVGANISGREYFAVARGAHLTHQPIPL